MVVRRVVGAVVVAAALASSACSGGSSEGGGPDRTTTTTRDAGGPTRAAAVDPGLRAISGLLDDDGRLPLDAALRVFSATVAPLPGVAPADLGDAPPGDAASIAIRRLLAARDELTPQAAAALDEVLAGEEGAPEAEVPAPTRHRAVDLGGGGEVPSLEALSDATAAIIGDLQDRSGHTLSLPVTLRQSRSGDALATPVGWTGSRARGCRITIPATAFGRADASATSTLAHEVWHCFQLDASPAAFGSAPLWLIEGQAEWAGEAYVGGSSSASGSWDTWLLSVDRSLWRRSYDAIGVYAVAAQAGADPWTAMLPMLGLGNVAAVESLFGAGAEEAVSAVAQRVVRAPEVGESWESQGPGITGADGHADLVIAEGDDQEAALDVGRFAVLPVQVTVPSNGDIVRVSIEGGVGGAVQLPGTELTRLPAGGSVRYCLKPEGCECPDGSTPGGDLPPVEPGRGAAAVGALDAGELKVVAGIESLDDACRRKLVGTWTTDAGDYLATLGVTSGMSCRGPYVLTFGADRSFSAGFDATCTVAAASGRAVVSFTGTYTDSGTTFTLADVTGSGTMTIRIAGTERTQPFPGGAPPAGEPVPYKVEGDVLTYTFRGSTFTFTHTG